MEKNKIKFLLIQIDEAHSTAWPIGLKNTPEPQKTFEERLERANNFNDTENPPFPILVDGWNNEFAELFRAWPDKYYCINNEYKVLAKAEYGSGKEDDAKIIEDCTVLIKKIISTL